MLGFADRDDDVEDFFGRTVHMYCMLEFFIVLKNVNMFLFLFSLKFLNEIF